MSTLPNTLKHGRIMIVTIISTSINNFKVLKTRKNSKRWSRNQSMYFLIIRLSKLLTRSVAYRNLWIGSRNKNFQLLNLFSSIVDLVLNWRTFGMPFTILSILLNLMKLIFSFWMKLPVKMSKYGLYSQEKNLLMLLKSATICWLLVQTS